MLRPPGSPNLVISLALLAWASLAPPLSAQDEARIRERRVLVWQGGPDQTVEIEAASGRRGFLGVALVDLTAELRSHFGVPEDRGVLISKVVAESPASAGGLRVGDVLTAIDGRPVRGVMELQLAIAKGRDGEEVELGCWRNGEMLALRPVLEVRDRPQFDISPLVARHHSLIAPLALEPGADSPTEVDIDTAWMESVVGRVGERLVDSSVLEQLEAMRVERQSLQETLDRMEERLRQLEAELGALADENR